MSSLVVLNNPASPLSTPPRPRLPKWLKRPIPSGNANFFTEKLLDELDLETVCDNAKCPNRAECYSKKTATFMILGNVCTRPCGFCSVDRGRPAALADDEPARVAQAARRMELKHVVITSVTRDDLPDGGSAHFAATVAAVRESLPRSDIEVLIPDFKGHLDQVDTVLNARPDVMNHNLETVPRLYRRVRRGASYQRSLDVLAHSKARFPQLPTKAGLMLGLGESTDELLDVFADLRAIGCNILTLGQYLAPSLADHLPVVRYLPPSEFDKLGALARRMGFDAVASGPFVRSSYHARDVLNASR